MDKKLILRITIWSITGLILIFSGLVYFYGDINKVKGYIKKDFKERLNCSVDLGEMNWDFDGGKIGFSITEFSVIDPNGNLIIQAGPSRIVWRLRSIIFGRFNHFKRIESINFFVNLERRKNGEINIFEIFPSEGKGKPPKIDNLVLHNGIVHFTDLYKDLNKDILYKDININWQLSKGTKYREVLATTRIGSTKSPSFIKVKGHYTDSNKFNWKKDEVSLYLLAKKIRIADWESYLTSVPEINSVSGKFSGLVHLRKKKGEEFIHVRSKNKINKLDLIINNKFSKDRIYIPRKKISLLGEIHKDKIRIKNLRSTVDKLTYNLTGYINNYTKNLPEVDLKLRTNRFNFKEVKKYIPFSLLPSDTRARIEPINDDGFVKLNLKINGPFIAPKYNGVIFLNDFNLTPESGFLQFIHGLNGKLTLEDHILNIDYINIPIEESTLKLKGKVDNKKIVTSLNIFGEDLSINTLQNIAIDFEPSTQEFLSQVISYGKLDLNLDVLAELNKAPEIKGKIGFHDAGIELFHTDLIELKDLFGDILLDGKNVIFQKLTGLINEDDFYIDGSASLKEDETVNLHLKADQLKIISSLISLVADNSPIKINKDSISGELSKLDISVSGTFSEPSLDGMIFINDIAFKLPDFPDAFDNISGNLVFHDSILEIDDITGSILSALDLGLPSDFVRERYFHINGFVKSLFTKPSPKIEIISEPLEVSNIWKVVKKGLQGTEMEEQINDILDLSGHAQFDIFLEPEKVTGMIIPSNIFVKYKYSPFDLYFNSGNILIKDSDIEITSLIGMLGEGNNFNSDLIIYKYDKPDMYVKGTGKVDLDIPYSADTLNPKFPKMFKTNMSLPTNVTYTFKIPVANVEFDTFLAMNFSIDIDPLMLKDTFDPLISKPMDLEYMLTGNIDLDTEKMDMKINKFNISTVKLSLNTEGEILMIDSESPSLMLNYHTDPGSNIYMIIKSVAPISKHVRVFGEIDLDGTINGSPIMPEFTWMAKMKDTMVQPIFEPNKRVNVEDGETSGYFDGDKGNVKAVFHNADYFSFHAMTISLSATYENPVAYIQEFSFDVDPGNIHLTGNYNPVNGNSDIEALGKDIEVSKLSEFIVLNPEKLRGNTNFTVMLMTSGLSTKDLIQNSQGEVSFSVTNGHIGEIALLHKGLQVASLFKQGIFGLNLRNIFTLFFNFKNGDFNIVDGKFKLNNGIVKEKFFHYRADNLFLNSFGRIDLNNFLANLAVYGYLPKKPEDYLNNNEGKGAVKILTDSVTFIPFLISKGLNYIPFVSTTPPKHFKFKIEGSLKDQDQVVKNTAKSFKWLKGKKLKKEIEYFPEEGDYRKQNYEGIRSPH